MKLKIAFPCDTFDGLLKPCLSLKHFFFFYQLTSLAFVITTAIVQE